MKIRICLVLFMFVPFSNALVHACGSFPARTLFNARGVVQTPMGTFFTGLASPQRSAYCPIKSLCITSLPPYGTTYSEFSQTPLYDVNNPSGPSVAVILALAHRVEGATVSPQGPFPPAGIDTFSSTFTNGRV